MSMPEKVRLDPDYPGFEQQVIGWAADSLRGEDDTESQDWPEYTRSDLYTQVCKERDALREALEGLVSSLDAVDAEAERAAQPGSTAWSSAPVVRSLHARQAARAALTLQGEKEG